MFPGCYAAGHHQHSFPLCFHRNNTLLPPHLTASRLTARFKRIIENPAVLTSVTYEDLNYGFQVSYVLDMMTWLLKTIYLHFEEQFHFLGKTVIAIGGNVDYIVIVHYFMYDTTIINTV